MTPEGLAGGYDAIKNAIECIEKNEELRSTICCEPQLGKRGLYPTISTKDTRQTVKDMMNLLAYADGNLSVFDIAEKINVPMWKLSDIIEKLKAEGILKTAPVAI